MLQALLRNYNVRSALHCLVLTCHSMEIEVLSKKSKKIACLTIIALFIFLYYNIEPAYGEDIIFDENIDAISDIIDISDQVVQSGGFPICNEDSIGDEIDKFSISKYASFDTTRDSEMINAYNKVASEIMLWDGSSSEIIVDVSTFLIPMSQSKNFVTTAINLHPECFVFSGQFKCSYNTSSNNINNVYLYIDKSYKKEDIKIFNDAAERILSTVDPSWTALQKIIYIHDYLVAHIDYDKTLSKFNAYNAIVEEDAVCHGYSLAYEYLLNRINADYECQIVTSSSINHAWNLVTFNGQKYYIDATWDDPTNEYKLYSSYKNFMVSQSKLHSTHASEDWINVYCEPIYGKLNTSSKYDSAPWMEMHSGMPMFGNTGIYYKEYSPMKLFVYDFDKEQSTEIASYNDVWKVWNKNAVLTASYSTLMRYDDYILITMPERILVVDRNGKMVKEYDSLSKDGYIYGAYLSDNIVNYDVYTHPEPAKGSYIGRYTQRIDIPKEIKYKKGDVTGDGEIAMGDVIKLARAIVGSVTLYADETQAADVTGDGEVAMGDVVKLARYVAGSITSL